MIFKSFDNLANLKYEISILYYKFNAPYNTLNDEVNNFGFLNSDFKIK